MSPRAGDADSKGGHIKQQLFVVKPGKTTKSLEIIPFQEQGHETHSS